MNSVFRRCEWVFSQTYLLGRVVKYAQRTQEILFHLRKKRLDSLRRAESVSGILQEFANSSLPASFGSLARLRLPGLSSRRPVSGSRVFHRGGSGSDREHSVPDPQRSGPTAAGSERFPASGHAENFLAAFRSGVLAEPASGPRQTSVGIVPSPGPPLQRDRRCRYDDPHYLWVPRRCGSGLYSQATPHATFLRPPLVQRRSERSQPGDGVAGRECAFLDRGRGVPRPGAAQAALVDGRRAHPAATGRGFLRPEDYRAPGKSRLRPCGRGADVSAFEAKDGGGTLSRVRSRLGGRRVYLHALSLEKGAPFRGRAPAHKIPLLTSTGDNPTHPRVEAQGEFLFLANLSCCSSGQARLPLVRNACGEHVRVRLVRRATKPCSV